MRVRFTNDGLGIIVCVTDLSGVVREHSPHFTLVELQILKCLQMQAGQVVLRSMIEKAMRLNYCVPRLVDKHLSQIKKKFEEAGGATPIVTVRNAGYMWRG